MIRPWSFRLAILVGAVVSATGAEAVLAAVVTVEPRDLIRRVDLLNREVAVDDRVRLFQLHPGRGFDEIDLKRTPVVFRLPPKLRFAHSPNAPAIRIQGFLRREGEQWFCDVTDLELFPNDLERLNRGLAVLPVSEFRRRSTWAAWAERRALDFDDQPLLRRAREVEAEAIRLEAERPGDDPARHWFQLARRARDRKVPEPEAGALAHRSFRRQMEGELGLESLRALTTEIAAFFPKTSARVPAKVDLSLWERPYANSPGAAYRSAPSPVRDALDRRLWADADQRLLEAEAAADPAGALTLAGQAASQLPDRPELARRLVEAGLGAATLKLGSLRLREVQALAEIYRDRLRDPARARKLLRDWLDDQRAHHLSPTDAEGRLALASQYSELLEDRATMIELLQEAWTIDPGSTEVTNAFRRLGFRKINDAWVDAAKRQAADDSPRPEESPVPVPSGNLKLRGKTPREVVALLGGRPNRISYSASQGQLTEQWIYLGARQNQYVNFLHSNPEATPTVISYYSLSHTLPRAAAP